MIGHSVLHDADCHSSAINALVSSLSLSLSLSLTIILHYAVAL